MSFEKTLALLFLRKDEALKLHAEAIEKFGGSHGLRDEGALESALAAAEVRYFYEGADLAKCAATYAYHLTKAQAFIDGNKRLAAVIAELFLEINDAHLKASNQEIVDLFLRIAAGKLSRNDVDSFFEDRIEYLRHVR